MKQTKKKNKKNKKQTDKDSKEASPNNDATLEEQKNYEEQQQTNNLEETNDQEDNNAQQPVAKLEDSQNGVEIKSEEKNQEDKTLDKSHELKQAETEIKQEKDKKEENPQQAKQNLDELNKEEATANKEVASEQKEVKQSNTYTQESTLEQNLKEELKEKKISRQQVVLEKNSLKKEDPKEIQQEQTEKVQEVTETITEDIKQISNETDKNEQKQESTNSNIKQDSKQQNFITPTKKSSLKIQTNLQEQSTEKQEEKKEEKKEENKNETIVTSLMNEKNKGNELFKSQKYQESIQQYKQALTILKKYYEESATEDLELEQQYEIIVNIEIPCNLNISICQIKLKNYQKAIKYSTKVLQYEQNNIKALYRRAYSYYQLDQLDYAEADTKIAMNYDKNDSNIKQLWNDIKQKHKQYKEKEKQLGKKFIQQIQEDNNQTFMKKATTYFKKFGRFAISPIIYIKNSTQFITSEIIYNMKVALVLPLAAVSEKFCLRRAPSSYIQK